MGRAALPQVSGLTPIPGPASKRPTNQPLLQDQVRANASISHSPAPTVKTGKPLHPRPMGHAPSNQNTDAAHLTSYKGGNGCLTW
ncbi:hypothetical protein AAFF_G00408070 [Aldrovandia affinis]|uniref:Uncharacterized protein n=1 Tax=Aldrovandia affinis TaxID=143900 RepID=A0AAD7WJZ0_9TELE|nr:hypothetical protein AAFF_G00408070 [Aldrovandia affinis]